LKIREGVQFQDGEPCTAQSIKQHFDEMQRWVARIHPALGSIFLRNRTLKLVTPRPSGSGFPARKGCHGKNAGLSDRK
jgi:hypothetical protein